MTGPAIAVVALAVILVLLWLLTMLGHAIGRWYVVQTVRCAGGPSEPDEWEDYRITRCWTRRGAARICRHESLDEAPYSKGHRPVRVKAWKEEHGE